MPDLNTITQPVVQEQGVSDEITKEILNHLYEPNNLSQNTRIKPEQVEAMAKVEFFADNFNVPALKTFVNRIKELQISIHGLGRKEAVQMVQQRYDDPSILNTNKRKNMF